MVKSFAIIGTGVTGTAVLTQFTQQLAALHARHKLPSGITIATIDKHSVNGPGFPYDPEATIPIHLLNHPANEMGIKVVDEKGNEIAPGSKNSKRPSYHFWQTYDFVHWLQEKREWIIANFPDLIVITHPDEDPTTWQPDASCHYPRALFGYYMQDRFNEATAGLQKIGVKVQHFNQSEVIDVKRRNSQLVITLSNILTNKRQTITTDKLLLSTGRWARHFSNEPTSTVYFDTPFPAKPLVEKIKPNLSKQGRSKRILVAGMGLTSLDALLTIAPGRFARDKQGVLQYKSGPRHPQFYMVSRNGFFPVVRGLPATLPPLRYVTEANLQVIRDAHHGYLTLASLMPLFEKELQANFGKDAKLKDYFLPNITPEEKLRKDFSKALGGNVLFGLCRQVRSMFLTLQLTPEDRDRFLAEYKTLYIQNLASLPVVNAEKLLALFDAGVLQTIRLGKAPTKIIAGKDSATLYYGDHQSITVDYIINATGDEVDIEKNQDPLLTTLLNAGEVVANKSTYKANHVEHTRAAGIKVNNNYLVIKKDQRGKEIPSDNISAVGMLAAGWQPEKNFASASLEAAHVVVKDWMQSLSHTKKH